MGVSIEHQMIELYCFVDEFLKTHPRLAQWRHSPHAQPQFSEALLQVFISESFRYASLLTVR